MAAQAIDNVHALFVDLGIAAERANNAVELVIDRFDHWTNQKGNRLSPTICATVISEVL
jgi:hypothetical protein